MGKVFTSERAKYDEALFKQQKDRKKKHKNYLNEKPSRTLEYKVEVYLDVAVMTCPNGVKKIIPRKEYLCGLKDRPIAFKDQILGVIHHTYYLPEVTINAQS